jgi:hypothetical protein
MGFSADSNQSDPIEESIDTESKGEKHIEKVK